MEEALYLDYYYYYFTFIFFLILIIKNYFIPKIKNLPPSPIFPSLPIIGHLYLLKHPLHRALSRISARYGPILILQFGSRRVLVVSSPAAAEECLTEKDAVFADRPQLLAGKYLGYNYTSLATTSYGDHWRNLRRIASSEIFSSHRVQELRPIRADEVRFMIRKLCGLSPSRTEAVAVEMKSVLSEVTMNVAMRMLSGKRYYGGGEEKGADERKLREIVKETLELAGTSNIEDFLPILRWIGWRRLEKRLKGLQKKRDAFMQEVIGEIKRSMEKSQGSTITEVLLTLQRTDPRFYTDEMIRSFMLISTYYVLLAAGTDTSICTMEWALSLLLNNPRVLKKAQLEIDNVVGNTRLFEESDVTNLPYLHCIIKETMRMYPPGPLLPHQSSADCSVGGYRIPRGTMLIVNMWAIQNDPKVWIDPKVFRPERFYQHGLKIDGGTYRDGFKLLPFGFGRRSCPGEGLAMRMIGLVLGSLVQCFDWERVTTEMVDMTEGNGITMPKAKPLVAKCQPRPVMTKLLSEI